VYAARSVPTARRFLLVLGAAAAVVALLQGLTGLTELALYCAPLFLMVGLLLGGRFVGERQILARWAAARPRRRPVSRPSWPWGHDRALTSLLEQAACTLRGPPAGAVA
jgi:hypothetical protein